MSLTTCVIWRRLAANVESLGVSGNSAIFTFFGTPEKKTSVTRVVMSHSNLRHSDHLEYHPPGLEAHIVQANEFNFSSRRTSTRGEFHHRCDGLNVHCQTEGALSESIIPLESYERRSRLDRWTVELPDPLTTVTTRMSNKDSNILSPINVANMTALLSHSTNSTHLA